jgi:hypothetical protein
MSKGPVEKERLLLWMVSGWCVAIMLGALQAWALRHTLVADSMSYLDMAYALLRGNWRTAINGYWSPLYPGLLCVGLWLLKPSAYWEFSVAHLVNLAIYAVTLACFQFFWSTLGDYRRREIAPASKSEFMCLPDWSWLAIGYTLFLWCSLKLITVWFVTPDMCVAAAVLLASGLLLRIRMGRASWRTSVLLGLVLGLGYLAKAVMFPMAFVFLGIAMLCGGNLRKGLQHSLTGLMVFMVVAGPFIVALSRAKGRWTYGDTGRLNYAWYANSVTRSIHWQGGQSGVGTPLHPTRKLSDTPAVYEFGTPVEGTYPPWFDPSYWYEGLRPHFDLKNQLRALWHGLHTICRVFREFSGGLTASLLILFLVSGRGTSAWKDIASAWPLVIPAILGLGGYAMIHVELRYIGAFLLLFWGGLLSAVRLSDSPESRRLVAGATFAIILTIGLTAVGTTGAGLLRAIHRSDHLQWEVAQGLQQMGIRSGDSVASIGHTYGAYWAHLAQVRIVAEIPREEAASFWAADPERKTQIIGILARTGAKVLVAEEAPASLAPTHWHRIGNTAYRALVLCTPLKISGNQASPIESPADRKSFRAPPR